ncbi:MAG: UbiA prenyltransferase family protein [Candidatus Argoarchaeum ethanivorans]|uniref:UbiA prenyltransferase family protein n=1 Tax=Candidatus Argoarchaeum ethanivorans TaxID=2608793 RepID=A0A811T9I2_9EURY|nr:MAG: UbiA prenyltransferase family protein [Candidatus Argoarchaeum ethanivorans]
MTNIEDACVNSRFDKGDCLVSHLFKRFYTVLDKFVSLLTISSIFIAITGSLLPYFSFLLYGVRVDFKLLLASGLLTFTVYNLDKLTGIEEDLVNVPERAGFIEKNKKSVTFATIAAYIVALFLSFLQNPFAIFIILFPFCIGIVYSIKISNFRLKDITGIKNIVVALCWAVIGAFIPLAISFRDFSVISLIFYFFFTKLFINTVLFDVRDIKGDKMNGVKTIPVVFGRKRTKNILLTLNSTLIPWLVYSYLSGCFHIYFIVLVFSIGHGYWYILYFCREENTGKSLDLLVDGEWIPVVILAAILTQFA